MPSELTRLVTQQVPLQAADVTLISAAFEEADYAKGALLVAPQQPARYMFFLLEGFTRGFHYQPDGAEITNHLSGPLHFVTAYTSFLSGAPSEETVQALTACRVARISKARLDELYRQSHAMALFGLLMSERYLLFNNQRGKDLISLSATARYEKLLREEPLLARHVPLRYIASYLGIKPESLSRIRRQLIS